MTQLFMEGPLGPSKKKGMWMGGLVPMGYRAEEKRLVVEPTQAGTVRQRKFASGDEPVSRPAFFKNEATTARKLGPISGPM